MPYAVGESAQHDENNIQVCEGETLSTLDKDGRPLSAEAVTAAVRSVQSYCDHAKDAHVRGTTYGDYVRNATNAKRGECSCGSYQEWTIKVSAVFVPSGALNLNVIYRVQPGSGAWQSGASLANTNLPLESGTMPMGSTIQSYGTLAINGTVVESIYNSAGAAR